LIYFTKNALDLHYKNSQNSVNSPEILQVPPDFVNSIKTCGAEILFLLQIDVHGCVCRGGKTLNHSLSKFTRSIYPGHLPSESFSIPSRLPFSLLSFPPQSLNSILAITTSGLRLPLFLTACPNFVKMISTPGRFVMKGTVRFMQFTPWLIGR
jgi:hypothetical protein